MAETVAAVATEHGDVVVEADGDDLTIRLGRAKVTMSRDEAKTIALAILSPPEEWRRSMMWAVFDHQLEAIWALDAESREKPVLALQRLVTAMGNFGMLGGSEDESAVRRFLEAIGAADVVPGLPAIPVYEDDED